MSKEAVHLLNSSRWEVNDKQDFGYLHDHTYIQYVTHASTADETWY